MDKETLSNYGWVVICVLVLVVMISLATPFGSYVATAVQNTTTALTDTADKQAEKAGGVLDIINPVFEFWQSEPTEDAQNSAKIYYDRVYAFDLSGTKTAGVWSRDGSVTVYNINNLGDVTKTVIPAEDVKIEGYNISIPDPAHPVHDITFTGNTDGTIITAEIYWHTYDYNMNVIGCEFVDYIDLPLTDYTTIEDWLNAQ